MKRDIKLTADRRYPNGVESHTLDIIELVDNRQPCPAAAPFRCQRNGGDPDTTHDCRAGSHVEGKGDVRAGAVAEGGAKRSVISLRRVSGLNL